jgi:hypothetical protein
MRVSSGFLAFALVICSPTLVNSQVQIITSEHACEGANDNVMASPACENAWRPTISVVFLGRVTAVLKEDVPILLDGKKEHTEKLHVTFDVEEAFRGVEEKIIKVTSGGDLCAFPFTKGYAYIVYGRRLSSGEVYVSISSATKGLKDPDSADDLQYLRGLPTAPHGGKIYGTVIRYTSPENPHRMALRRGVPESGQKIEVQGSNQSYETIVDEQGNFSVSGLPPGHYRVVLNADAHIDLPWSKSTTVDLVDKACAEFRFRIDPFARNRSGNLDEQVALSAESSQ